MNPTIPTPESVADAIFGDSASVSVASNTHTIGLLFILAVYVARELLISSQQDGSGMAATRRPSMITSYIGVMLSVWALVFGVLQGTKRNGVGLRELIGGAWKSPRTIALDIGIAIGLVAAWFALVAIASTLATASGAGLRSSVNSIHPFGIVESILWVGMSINAGFCEEVVFRGYLQRQFQAMTRKVFPAICLQAIVFGLLHLHQGSSNCLLIAFYGILFGLVASWRRSLRPRNSAHAYVDIIVGIVVPMMSRA